MRKYFFIIFSFCLISCSPKDDANNEVEEIIFSKKDILLEHYLEYKFIPLETCDESLLGHLTKVEIVEDKIYILDAYKGHNIYVFDMNGKFLSTIGEKGSGPKEFVSPFDFIIDAKNRSIIIDDRHKQRLLYYNLDNYEFVTSKKIPFSYTDFHLLENDCFVFLYMAGYDTAERGREGKYAVITDSSFDIINSFYDADFRSHYSSSISKNRIYKSNQKTYLYHHLFPYVYEVDAKGGRCVHKISFDSFSFPPTNALKVDKEYSEKLSKTDYISAYALYESSELIFSQFTKGIGPPYFGLYNKKEKESFLFDLRNFAMSSGLEVVMIPRGATDDYIIASIAMSQPVENIRNQKLKELIENRASDENPIICLFKLK